MRVVSQQFPCGVCEVIDNALLDKIKYTVFVNTNIYILQTNSY